MSSPADHERPSRLRISLRLAMLLVTLCCLAAWYWQRPYEVEGTHSITSFVDGEVTTALGRRVDTWRRSLWGDSVRHGPERLYSLDGEVFFEAHWRYGVRDGLLRRWDEETGELIVELEFDNSRLVRFGDLPVHDFLAEMQIDPDNRLASELQKETDFEYQEVVLQDAVDDMSFRHDLTLMINGRALNDADFDWRTPVTASYRGIPLFAAMCGLLAPLELTCVYQYEALWITPEDDTSLRRPRLILDNASAQLRDKLAKRTQVEFLDQSLDSAFADLAAEHNIGIESELPADDARRISFSIRGVSLASALGMIFYEQDLWCEAHGDVLTVRPSADAP